MNTRHRPLAALTLALLLPFSVLADAPPPKAGGRKPPMTAAIAKPNGSGVDVQYSVDSAPRIGRNAAITVSFDGITDPAGALVHFTADAGLVLTGGEDRRLPAGSVTTLTLQAAPAAEGIAYLNVFTTQNGITSSTSIPVQVGKTAPSLSTSGNLKKTPAGEAVISMPAR